MNKKDELPQWLKWAREIQALGQTGLAFSQNHYEIERNTRIIELASEIIAGHTNLERKPLEKVLMNQPGYATPKIDVRSAVINDNKILLVKELDDGKWAMPGGWADIGNFPSEVAIRETKEESGYDISVKKIVGVFDANRRNGRKLELFHAFKIVFLCELTGGAAAPSNETSDVGFFGFDELPKLSPNRTNERHIEEIKLHLENPARLALFD
ncbi:MAG: NUDIX hydrolase [Ignavibacteria bacterium]|jgi:ADP-ribose pyrophosphatase YjhB (NUDIX family)